MRNHEIRQKDESREDYVRRISKFPILSPNTILRAVFPAVRLDTLRYIKDCARSEFPNSFPPEDNKGIPFIDPEYISTKAFAKWVAEENIFVTWIELGEEVSTSAKLFIDLVNGKAIDSKQAAIKVKRKKPDPTTDNGKLEYLKTEVFIPLVKKLVKKNPKWQYSQISKNSEVKDALANSGLPKGTPSVDAIKKWICIARKKAFVNPPVGRPSN
jgi:hypothetical protein